MDQTSYQQLPESSNGNSTPFNKVTHKSSVIKSSHGCNGKDIHGHYQNGSINQSVMELHMLTKREDGNNDGGFRHSDRSALLQDDEGENREQVKSGITLSSFNFINSIIGAGALGMPYAMKQAGLFLGILLLTLMAVITDFTVILLVESGAMAGQSSYMGLMKSAFGRFGYALVLLCQFIFPFLAMNGYAVIIGDSLVRFFQLVGAEETILTNRQFVIGMAILLVMTPLCLLKKISKLGMASLFSLICVSVVIITVFIRLTTLGPEVPHTDGAFNFAHDHVPQAIGVMAFAFVCHHNTFLIYNSLETNTMDRFSTVTHISVSLSWISVMLLSVAGYMTFTGHTLADILENYCSHDYLVTIARLCYGISMMLTYPIECFVCRQIIEHVFFAEREESTIRHIIITLTIIAATIPVPMVTDCLGTVLELNGSLAAIPLVFIFPCACYIRIAEGSAYAPRKVISAIILVIGIAIVILGTITTILGAKDCTMTQKSQFLWCNATTDLNITRSINY